MMRFTDKIVLVTGGGQGLGRAAALRFASEGADIAIADTRLDVAHATARDITGMGRRALVISADVSDEGECKRMVEKTMAHFKRLDVTFTNAGIIGTGGIVANMPTENWDQVIAVNLRGTFLTCKYSIPALIASEGMSIVTMASSMAGWDTSLTGAAYMASKEGVSGLTRSLALQLAPYGIRVNAVCPGVIKTRLSFRPDQTEEEWETHYERFSQRIPLRRVGVPEDVAAAVAFLASDEARHITGSMLLIDGGQTLQSWSNAPDDDAYPVNIR
ncbi:MAG: SDR family oxidoreductase [Anaerolineae bacterium]|nr:SDR family oxidoreductase [Anaerolineae bacterium]